MQVTRKTSVLARVHSTQNTKHYAPAGVLWCSASSSIILRNSSKEISPSPSRSMLPENARTHGKHAQEISPPPKVPPKLGQVGRRGGGSSTANSTRSHVISVKYLFYPRFESPRNHSFRRGPNLRFRRERVAGAVLLFPRRDATSLTVRSTSSADDTAALLSERNKQRGERARHRTTQGNHFSYRHILSLKMSALPHYRIIIPLRFRTINRDMHRYILHSV